MTSPNSTFSSGQILTAAQQNNLPFGWVYNQTLATTQTMTTVADLSGLSITFAFVAGRKYLMSLTTTVSVSVLAEVSTYITDSANVAVAEYLQTVSDGKFATSTIQTIVSPGAGTFTYKARGAVSTGTLTVYGQNSRESIAAKFIIQDIGIA